MWWRKLSLLAVSACFVLALGCGNTTGDDDDDDDDNNTVTPSDSPSESPSPTPLQMFDVTVNGTNGGVGIHEDGNFVGFRILDDTGAQVACGNDQTFAVGAYTYTFVDALTEGETYTVEWWYDDDAMDNQAEYQMGADHIWARNSTAQDIGGATGLANASADVVLTIDHPGTSASITWPDGVGCN